MKPDNSVIRSGLPEKARAYALSEPGRQYAIYIFGAPRAQLALDLPSGNYSIEWLNPISGRIEKREKLKHPGGPANLSSPLDAPEVALRLAR